MLSGYFADTYVAPNFIVAAVGNLEHDRVRDLVSAAFARAGAAGTPIAETAPSTASRVILRTKDLEQSHVCLGTAGVCRRRTPTATRPTRSTRCSAAR